MIYVVLLTEWITLLLKGQAWLLKTEPDRFPWNSGEHLPTYAK